MTVYADRFEAGRRLAERLMEYANRDDVVVLALPRGGIPVGFEVAQRLNAPLDVFTVRKLGVPSHEELAMGAIASGGIRVLNQDVVAQLQIPEWLIDQVAAAEQQELERREQAYREGRPPISVKDKTIILVDDGLATGASMRAAVQALRLMEPSAIIAAVPVGAPDTCELLRNDADAVVCAVTPENFVAVGRWYEDFSQTTDEEVRELLAQAAQG